MLEDEAKVSSILVVSSFTDKFVNVSLYKHLKQVIDDNMVLFEGGVAGHMEWRGRGGLGCSCVRARPRICIVMVAVVRALFFPFSFYFIYSKSSSYRIIYHHYQYLPALYPESKDRRST